MIKLIASDLDGTLLSDDKKLPADFPRVLQRLKSSGIIFAAASGRDFNGAAQFFGSMIKDIIFICDNGANIYIDGKPYLSHTISAKNKEDILAKLADIGSKDFIMCGSKSTYYSYGSPAFMKKMSAHYSPTTFVENVRDIQDEIYRISVYDASGDIRSKVYTPLMDSFERQNTIHISADIWLDIMDKSADKGVGMKFLQNKFSISPEETMAFGDFYNDIPLLNSAGHPYVMANAKEDLKQLYPNHAPGCNEGGVTAVIKNILFK